MIRKYLLQRYPYSENKWKLILPISLFIALFMLIFKPFGLSELEIEFRWLILAGYGAVTFIILILDLLILPLIFPGSFNEEKWTVFKEILFLILILFTVGLGNLVYSSWTMGFHLTVINVLIFQSYTVAVGIIPVSVIILLKQNYLNKKHRESAKVISDSLGKRDSDEESNQQVRIASENDREEVMINIRDLLFIKSEGNYIIVGHLINGKLTKTLLRNTLKYAADLMTDLPFIYQCHRSWLVNLYNITRVKGNSQGLRLVVQGFEEDIPVARNNSAEFRQRIAREKG